MGVSSRRGFTFAVSALLIALTLISMAFFASQWRKSAQVAYNEVLPADAMRMGDKISGDFASLFGVGVGVVRTGSTSALVQLSFGLPLKKEGLAVADVAAYSQSLAQSLRGSGVEATVFGNFSGSSPTVAFLPDSGFVSLSNDQSSDSVAYSHPLGWQPSAINTTFFCGKRVLSVGSISVESAGGSNIPYIVTVREQNGRTFSASANATTQSNATLSVLFEDGSEIVLRTSLSGGAQNTTVVNYTKSPGSYLVLPFEENATLSAGGVRDYSSYLNHFTLGGGNSANAPSHSVSCRAGSCYIFDGSNDYLNGTVLNLTQGAGVGTDNNFGFETTYNVSG